MGGTHGRAKQAPPGNPPAPRKIEIRLAEPEYQAIRLAASRPGRGVSLARFVAEAALAAAGATPPPQNRRRPPSRLALAEISDAVAAVNRIGNNLNQVAREKNATGEAPAETAAVIQRVLRALERLARTAEAADRGPP